MGSLIYSALGSWVGVRGSLQGQLILAPRGLSACRRAAQSSHGIPRVPESGTGGRTPCTSTCQVTARGACQCPINQIKPPGQGHHQCWRDLCPRDADSRGSVNQLGHTAAFCLAVLASFPGWQRGLIESPSPPTPHRSVGCKN